MSHPLSKALVCGVAAGYGKAIAQMVAVRIDDAAEASTLADAGAALQRQIEAALRTEGMAEDLVAEFNKSCSEAMKAEWGRLAIAGAGEGSSARH